jgi:abortive infection bacteriophage resistance protein
MSKINFSKQALTYQQQLDLLQSRGLLIEDPDKALFLLENISYYRLSGYWYPLLSDKENHVFKIGSCLTTAFHLYCFDKELRKLMLTEMEKIEVAVRAKMIYILSHEHGPFWYQNPGLFSSPKSHAISLQKIEDEFKRSDEVFLKAFSQKYQDPMPPSWMILEVASFGTLSQLYGQLKPGHLKRQIANYFGLPDTAMRTWLHSIVYLRNLCAHHSRLWNRKLAITPENIRTPMNSWMMDRSVRTDKTYFALSMVKYFLTTVNPNNTFTAKIDDLLAKFPEVNPGAMGFPADWKTEPLWQ